MKIYRALIFIICLVLCAASLASCSKPPELATVKDEFAALIEASKEINEIFFGKGLPVYDRADSTWSEDILKFDEESKTYYYILEDETYKTVIKYIDSETKKSVYLQKTDKKREADAAYEAGGYYYYPIPDYKEEEKHYVYDKNSPVYYDYVLEDCKYQSIDSIKTLAEKVYTPDFLNTVYNTMFVGFVTDTGSVVYAKFSDSDENFFMQSNRFDPYFTEHTTYDFSTMKIVRPSRADYVNVEISATGRYFDYDKGEIVTGNYQKTIKFVLTENGWRLDSPTY